MRAASLFVMLCGFAASANTQMPRAATPSAAAAGAAQTSRANRETSDWDAAFQDRSRERPLHFTAHYTDAHNTTHRLEEWRIGQEHLRRLTDDRIDLHADAAPHLPGQPREYIWTILDLQKHVAHRISTVGMMRLGMLYSYYAMAHVLTRPAGQFTVERTTAPVAGRQSVGLVSLPAGGAQMACKWYQVSASGLPEQRICWLTQWGVPASLWSETPQGWHLDFAIDKLDTRPAAMANFAVNTAGFQVRNVDELETED